MNTCIIKTNNDGKKFIMRNCSNVEECISIIKNATFKNAPVYEGVGLDFTARTENWSYSIIEGNHKPTAENFLH